MGKSALILFADVDGLKETNDQLGHQDGDAALKGTANLLRDSFRSSDIIARLGGDEFAILSVGSIHEGEKAILSRLEGKLARHNGTENRPYTLSLSVGIVAFDPMSPCSINELLDRADEIMYMQKSAKKRNGALKLHHT